MQLTALRNLCERWDGSSEQFKLIVAGTTTTLGLYLRELADEFEVAESTVSRWARGTAKPHPRMQKMIVTDIGRRVQNALRARGFGSSSSSMAARGR